MTCRVGSGRGGSPKRCAEAEDLRRDGLIFVGPLGRFPRACSLGARPTRAAVWFFSQSVRRRVFLFIAYDTGRHGFGACAVRRRSRRRRGRLQTATARRELLDSGADGSPKSWRALADDLREVGSFRRRSADARARALAAPDRRVRRSRPSPRPSTGASFCDTGRHGFGACAVVDTRDVGAAGSKR